MFNEGDTQCLRGIFETANIIAGNFKTEYTSTHWSSSWGQILLDFLFICENFSYLVISTQQLDYELKISTTIVDEGTLSCMEIESE